MSTEREDLIRRRAYEIWEKQGRPEGQEMVHWRQAEAELSAIDTPDTKPVNRKAARTRASKGSPSRAKPREGKRPTR